MARELPLAKTHNNQIKNDGVLHKHHIHYSVVNLIPRDSHEKKIASIHLIYIS